MTVAQAVLPISLSRGGNPARSTVLVDFSAGQVLRGLRSLVLPSAGGARQLVGRRDKANLDSFLAELSTLRHEVIASGVPLLNDKDIDERLADMRGRAPA